MGTSLGWGSNKLVVQWISNPLTAIYNNLAYRYKKEMGISGCTEKCHHPIYFVFPQTFLIFVFTWLTHPRRPWLCHQLCMESKLLFWHYIAYLHCKNINVGMDKVRGRGAPLPGNDKENWGNHHMDVIGIWKGRREEGGRRTPLFIFTTPDQAWIKCRSREHRSQEMTRKIEEIITWM